MGIRQPALLLLSWCSVKLQEGPLSCKKERPGRGCGGEDGGPSLEAGAQLSCRASWPGCAQYCRGALLSQERTLVLWLHSQSLAVVYSSTPVN